jgi:hypothetical protein
MCAHCHVVSLEIELNDIAAVDAACTRLGWRLNRNQKTYNWVGRWYDDSPVPRHLFTTEEEYQRVCNMTSQQRKAHMPTILGKCDHAIQIPGARGEIGIIERDGKLLPIWDYYTCGLGDVRAENGMNGFVQAYAAERAKLEASLRGNFCTEQQEQDGTILLRIQIPEF